MSLNRHKEVSADKNIEPLDARDKKLEKLWKEFGDALVNPDSECMEESFLGFPAGTNREEIWHWFDARYSKGVAHLLCGEGFDRTDENAKLIRLKLMCDYCDAEHCIYNPDGICLFPIIGKQKPRVTEEDGCKDFCYKEETD